MRDEGESMRKPMMVGLGPVVDRRWNARKFTFPSARSTSVGDVVEEFEPDGKRFLCAAVGWKELAAQAV